IGHPGPLCRCSEKRGFTLFARGRSTAGLAGPTCGTPGPLLAELLLLLELRRERKRSRQRDRTARSQHQDRRLYAVERQSRVEQYRRIQVSRGSLRQKYAE